MAEDERAPAAYAADIEAARDRLIAFAVGCSEEEWRESSCLYLSRIYGIDFKGV